MPQQSSPMSSPLDQTVSSAHTKAPINSEGRRERERECVCVCERERRRNFACLIHPFWCVWVWVNEIPKFPISFLINFLTDRFIAFPVFPMNIKENNINIWTLETRENPHHNVVLCQQQSLKIKKVSKDSCPDSFFAGQII